MKAERDPNHSNHLSVVATIWTLEASSVDEIRIRAPARRDDSHDWHTQLGLAASEVSVRHLAPFHYSNSPKFQILAVDKSRRVPLWDHSVNIFLPFAVDYHHK
jgi:hypothetical protein